MKDCKQRKCVVYPILLYINEVKTKDPDKYDMMIIGEVTKYCKMCQKPRREDK